MESVQELSLIDSLTSKEQQVYELLSVGRTNREIADSLSITPSTVKFHVHNICFKLGVTNRTSAIAYSQGSIVRQPVLAGGAYTEDQIRKAAKQVVDLDLQDRKVVNQVVADLLAALGGKL